MRDFLATVDTRQQTNQCNTNLYCGQQLAGKGLHLQGNLSSTITLLGGIIEAVFARGNQGNLGHGEEAIDQDQDKNDKNFHFRFIVRTGRPVCKSKNLPS